MIKWIRTAVNCKEEVDACRLAGIVSLEVLLLLYSRYRSYKVLEP